MEGIKKYRKIIYVITDFLACVCFNSFFFGQDDGFHQ